MDRFLGLELEMLGNDPMLGMMGRIESMEILQLPCIDDRHQRLSCEPCRNTWGYINLTPDRFPTVGVRAVNHLGQLCCC